MYPTVETSYDPSLNKNIVLPERSSQAGKAAVAEMQNIIEIKIEKGGKQQEKLIFFMMALKVLPVGVPGLDWLIKIALGLPFRVCMRSLGVRVQYYLHSRVCMQFLLAEPPLLVDFSELAGLLLFFLCQLNS